MRGLDDVLESVQKVHAIVDKEISDGTNPKNIFIAGLSQGGIILNIFFGYDLSFLRISNLISQKKKKKSSC